jgi:hypothetical protein
MNAHVSTIPSASGTLIGPSRSTRGVWLGGEPARSGAGVDGIVFQHDPTDHVAQLVMGSVEAPEPAPARRRGRPWPQAAANHVGLRVRVATAGGRGADLRGGAVREEPVAHVGHRAALDALAGVRAAELGWLGGDFAGHGVRRRGRGGSCRRDGPAERERRALPDRGLHAVRRAHFRRPTAPLLRPDARLSRRARRLLGPVAPITPLPGPRRLMPGGAMAVSAP